MNAVTRLIDLLDELRNPVRETFAFLFGFLSIFAGIYLLIYRWDEMMWHACWIMFVSGGISLYVEVDDLIDRFEIQEERKRLWRRRLQSGAQASFAVLVISILITYCVFFCHWTGLV